MAKFSIHNVAALANREIFFDANVLLYIFWPSGSFSWENNYSTAYSRLLRQGNELVVDFIVISEVINRAIRLEYEKHLLLNNISKNNLSFKNYRNSVEGQTALADIYLMIDTNILSKFTFIGKSFSKADIQSFLIVDTLDFSDKAILSICRENGFVLITNDVDFKTSNIDILTSNPSILRN